MAVAIVTTATLLVLTTVVPERTRLVPFGITGDFWLGTTLAVSMAIDEIGGTGCEAPPPTLLIRIPARDERGMAGVGKSAIIWD